MKLLRQATAALTANVATAAAQYALVVLVARGLGPDAFGTFMFALAFGSLAAVVPNFGLDRIVVRQVVRDPSSASTWFSAAAALRLALGVPAAVLALLVLRVVAPDHAVDATWLIVLSLIAALGAELCRALLYASEAMLLETKLRLAGRALTLAAASAAVFAGRTLRHVALALAVAAAVEAGLYLRVTTRRLGLRWRRPDTADIRALAAAAVPIASNTLFVLLYFRANLLLLAMLAGTAAAGQFGAAVTFLQALQVASGSLASVVLPNFVQTQSGGPVPLARRIDTTTRLLLAGVIPTAAGLSLLAPEIVQVVYSARYAEAVPALSVLAWAAVFMFIGSLHGALLIALDAERTLFWISLVAAVVSITANVVLVSAFGVLGASWATVGTEALVGLSCLALVRRRTGAPGPAALAWPAAIAAGAIALAVALVGQPPAPRALAVVGIALAALAWVRVADGPAWRSLRLAIGGGGDGAGA